MYTFGFLLIGDLRGFILYAAFSCLLISVFYVAMSKRSVMIASSTPAWRKQHLLKIGKAVFVLGQTLIFVGSEMVSCIVIYAFNTQLQRDGRLDFGTSESSNVVESQCGPSAQASIPMMLCCVYFSMGSILTCRKSTVTSSRLASLQLPLIDIVDALITGILAFYAIVLFSFRNLNLMPPETVQSYTVYWCCLLTISFSTSYMRDRLHFTESKLQLVDVADEERLPAGRRETIQPSNAGVPTRTRSRTSTVLLLGKEQKIEGRARTGTIRDSEARSRVASEGEPIGGFDLNPGML
jgi:hypothetical protein